MAAKLTDSGENLKPPSWLLPAKIAVIVMGVMILAGLGVIAYTIATRLAGSGPQDVREASPAAAAAPVIAPASSAGAGSPDEPFGTLEVELPEGARLGPARFDDGRMILQLTLADGATGLLVVDLASGRNLGTIILRPQAD